MTTQESAFWLLEEHRTLEKVAHALQEKTAIVPRVQLKAWIEGVRAAFEHFRAHMVKLMAMENRGGYMLPVLEQQPALSRAVERLGHEHSEIERLMAGIHRDLQGVSERDALIVRDICRRIESLLHYVEHHEREENLVVTSTFGDDLGTED